MPEKMKDIDISSLGLTDTQVRVLNAVFVHQDVTYITSRFLHEVLKCDEQTARVIIWVIAGVGMLTPVIIREGLDGEEELALQRKGSHKPVFTNGNDLIERSATPEIWMSIHLHARFWLPSPSNANKDWHINPDSSSLYVSLL